VSCDFGVWFPYRRLSHAEASALYARLCEDDTAELPPHPAVDAFYAELTARYPEIDSIPEDRVDDVEFCPWSCALDRRPGHVIMTCVWCRADRVWEFVKGQAQKHGLAFFDPQEERIYYPDVPLERPRRPWWRFW